MRHRAITLFMAGTALASAADLRITTYDNAHLSSGVREATFELVGRIFHLAGITVTVLPGDVQSREGSLITYPQRPLRGRENEATCRARRDIALEIVGVTPPSTRGNVLGTAEPLAHEGLNARVFDDRVRDVSFRQNGDHAVVLAHAIAHEIGHVLLLNGRHSPSGLMSARWSDAEYSWMARTLMLFTSDEAHAIRSRLNGYGCPNLTSVARR